MTVKQFFENKYRTAMLTMDERKWARLKEEAEFYKVNPSEILYMCFEITAYDIKANGGYNGELYINIKEMHEKKLLASNKHRNYSGKIESYWLTPKGFKALEIC